MGILGRNEKVAEGRAAAIEEGGGKAIALIADVLNKTELETAKKQVFERFGRLDGLVNAAGGNIPEGVLQPEDALLLDIADGRIGGEAHCLVVEDEAEVVRSGGGDDLRIAPAARRA